MKKEVIAEEHCPYCKRHCPLSNPHCKKGKTLAEEKKVKKGINELVIEPLQVESGLLHLFYKCLQCLPHNKDDDKSNKKKTFYIASILLEKGELTKNELEKYVELSSKKLKKILLKMEKKNYICWKNAIEEKKISLTESGLDSVKRHRNKKSKDRSELFSALNEAEKECLEQLLKKLYTDWSR